jgi:predicted amidohydrolase
MTEPAPLTIAVFQCLARDEDAASRLDRLETAATEAAAGGARLLVTPEAFVSGYGGMPGRIHARAEPADGPSAQRAAGIAAQHGIAIVLGYPEAADGVVYNAALCIGPDGSMLANHRKVGLSGTDEQATYAHGDAITVFELDGHRIGVLICYDVEFPELVRAGARAGATVFAVPTALVTRWPVVADKMIPTRALENGVYIAYTNYAGREDPFDYLGSSCIVGPDGEDLARAGHGEELVVATVEWERVRSTRTKLPYLEDCRWLPEGG